MKILMIGSLTIDYINDKKVPGGTALYSLIPALFFGTDVKIFAVFGDDYPWVLDYEVEKIKSTCTTTFKHIYKGETRESYVLNFPEQIFLDNMNLDNYDGVLVNLTLGEVTIDSLSHLIRSSKNVRGIDLQGFLRLRKLGKLQHLKEVSEELILFLRNFDIISFAKYEKIIEPINDSRIFIERLGSEGSLINFMDEQYLIPAYKVSGDTTGAGDAFLSSFLIKYIETKNIIQAGCAASALTSLVIDGSLRPEIEGEKVKIIEIIEDRKEHLSSEFIKRYKYIYNNVSKLK